MASKGGKNKAAVQIAKKSNQLNKSIIERARNLEGVSAKKKETASSGKKTGNKTVVEKSSEVKGKVASNVKPKRTLKQIKKEVVATKTSQKARNASPNASSVPAKGKSKNAKATPRKKRVVHEISDESDLSDLNADLSEEEVSSEDPESSDENSIVSKDMRGKQRTGKYKDAELTSLLDLCFKFYPVIEGNISNAAGGLSKEKKDRTRKHITDQINRYILFLLLVGCICFKAMWKQISCKYFCSCSLGHNKRTVKKVKKKWQDMKSKTVTKGTRNRNKTGNLPLQELTKYEQRIEDFLEKRNSNIVCGIPGGLESTDDDVSCNDIQHDINVFKYRTLAEHIKDIIHAGVTAN